jgi:hypothetical protein
MSSKLLQGLLFFTAVLTSFFFGVYVGGAPVRKYMELTGGPAGHAATDLKNLSDRLIDRRGEPRDADAIADRSIQELRVHLLLAAQLYCYMPDQYQQVAKQSAIRVKGSLTDTDERTARALSFLINGESASGNKCFST